MNKTMLALAMAMILGACGTTDTLPTDAARTAPELPLEQQQADAAQALAQLVDSYFEENLKLDPFYAPYLGDKRYNDQFGDDLSEAYISESRALNRRYLEKLAGIDRALLEEQDKLTYDVFQRDRRLDIEAERFPEYLLPFNQFYSRASSFAQFGSGQSAQPFQTVKDYDDFLKKADGFLPWVDSAILRLKQGVQHDVVLPRTLVERILPQLADHVVSDYQKSLFWDPIRKLPAEFSQAEKLWLTDAYRKSISEKIIPGYKKLHTFLKQDYLPKARKSVGFGALPDGQAWYAYYAKLHTTSDLTPEQIHRIGLSEVARILSEMEQVKQQVGFRGDLKAFFTYLNSDDQFYYQRGEELLAGYRALKEQINDILPNYFDVMPKTDYEVREVEAFRAASSAGASYEAGSPDGTRPGIFYVNTHNLRAQPKFGMETLSLHEAAPGHHFQISIQQEMENLPKFRRFGGYTAFDEGWALYAESIGKEMGLFTDPYQYYGRLSDEMLRAMRLVVDTGLHAKGWTREQAITYMRENSSMAESDVIAEVERYMAIPGQALSYKIGQLKLTELRRYAEQELGEAFDVKEFHNQVLTSGALPMAVLEAKIRRWVAGKKN